MAKVYYDADGDVSFLKCSTIGIIGYGIQGRAQSQNLRDSGFDVIVGNRDDSYQDNANKDGFQLHSLSEVAEKADVIMILVPDDAQQGVYENYIQPHIKKGKTLSFAHGFSLRYKRIVPPADVDVLLLAPRMPGRMIRQRYLDGSGAPVFVGVHQDYTGTALKKVLSLAKGIGATRVGALEVSVEEETEVDHFIEHALIPIIIRAIRVSFDFLVEQGYSREVALMETFSSGEIGELLFEGASDGLYEVFVNNTSPTAQFGTAYYGDKVFPEKEAKKMMKDILDNIKDGSFAEILKKEGEQDYPLLKKYREANKKSLLTQTHQRQQELFKF